MVMGDDNRDDVIRLSAGININNLIYSLREGPFVLQITYNRKMKYK